ncbi:uncharacterized protein LOC115209929, partial [Argonauta hians]
QNICNTETVATHSPDNSNNVTPERYRGMMRKLPQAVVLITTAIWRPDCNSWVKRGITCSSLLSISLQPPIVSFCLHKHSHLSKFLYQSQQFAVNFIGGQEVKCADIFSRVPAKDEDQFSGVSHFLTKEGIPVLNDASTFLCKVCAIHNIEDRSVWYGQVTDLLQEDAYDDPILHYKRAYHRVGTSINPVTTATSIVAPDQLFIYLQLIWSEIKEHGVVDHTHHIRENLQKNIPINNSNWHETVISFYIDLVQIALKANIGQISTFEEFVQKNQEFLKPRELLYSYYSEHVLNSEQSKQRYILPDKKSLPAM